MNNFPKTLDNLVRSSSNPASAKIFLGADQKINGNIWAKELDKQPPFPL